MGRSLLRNERRLLMVAVFVSWLQPFCQAFASPFAREVTKWLNEMAISWKEATELDESLMQTGLPRDNGSMLLTLGSSSKKDRLLLHCLPSPQTANGCISPTLTRRMTNAACDDGLTIIHLHEDVWRQKGDVVRARLLVRVRGGRRIFARKTTVSRITAKTALPFLQYHHLWSAVRSKYYYGLKDSTNELVAVASFSARRNVKRKGVMHRSHELIRYCSQRDTTVVGGITKLIQKFVVDQKPDDIVTVIDRDWGGGSGWHAIGFETVHIMPPLTMVVDSSGIRRHLVGSGIQHGNTTTNGRLGLPSYVLQELSQLSSASRAFRCLTRHGLYPVHDAGVERLMMLVPESKAAREHDSACTELWNESEPSYATTYYSENSGIAALLKFVNDFSKR